MCLILIAHRIRRDLPLVIVANRDEFLDRPTAPLAFWADRTHVLGGRDLKEGGTWLGLSTSGALAAVTNYREPGMHDPDRSSRGALVTGFLDAVEEPRTYLGRIEADVGRFNGFNLLAWRDGKLGYISNRDPDGVRMLDPGLYGVSNHILDTPWPKVIRGKRMLADALESDALDAHDLLDIGLDAERAADAALPSTGMTLAQERALSSIFIRMEGYGTRSTTVVVIDTDGLATCVERTFDAEGRPDSVEQIQTQIEMRR